MSLAPQIIGTLAGIPRALRLNDEDDDALYAVAAALQEARNAVLGEALDREAIREGYRIVEEWRARHDRGVT